MRNRKGSWVYKEPTPHRCAIPILLPNPGSKWKCDECGQLWVVEVFHTEKVLRRMREPTD